MDAIQPVGAMIQPQQPGQGLNAYSTLLGIQHQRVGLEQQQQELSQQTSQATIAAQNAKETQAGAQLLSDPVKNGIMDAQGNVLPTAQATIMRAMPTTGAQRSQQIIEAARAKVGFQSDVANLSDKLRGQVGAVFSADAAGNASREQTVQNLTQLVQDSPQTAPVVMRALAHLPQEPHSTGNPQQDAAQQAQHMQQLNQYRLNFGRAVTGPAGAAGYGDVNTGTFSTGGQTNVLQTTRAGGATIAGSVPNTLAPQVVTTPAGPLQVWGGAGGGGGGGGTAPPAKAPQGGSGLQTMTRPGLNAPRADQENYQARVKQLGDEYQSVSTAANDPMNGVQATRYRNQRVLDLAPQASTGPGLKALNVIASRLPGSTGDAYQDLGHYTAQNSAALAKLMGVPNTNMGQETAAAAAGNVERNPGALMEITRANDALNTGFDLYNRGLAKVTNNGSDMSRAAAYKQAFGQNVDVGALRWADAHRRGDQEEIAALRQKYGDAGIAQFQQKLKTLKALAERGDTQ